MNSLQLRVRHLVVLAAGAALVLATAGGPVFAAPAVNFKAYAKTGFEPSSTGDCSALPACPAGDSCTCIGVQGSGTTSVLGNATYTGNIQTDITAPLGGGQCYPLSGNVLIVSQTDAAQKIALNFAGTGCIEFSTLAGDPWAMNAVFTVDGANSGGGFAGAIGSGNISGSSNGASPNVKILGSLLGTIKTP